MIKQPLYINCNYNVGTQKEFVLVKWKLLDKVTDLFTLQKMTLVLKEFVIDN